VGAMMIQNVQKIEWNRSDESIPAFLMMLGIPLSYSIADGLALGFITYPLLKIMTGKVKEIKWPMALSSLALLLYFIFVRSKLG
jgi:AGZA family xanthine/uracil permease-like MFS transporter